MDLKYVKDFAEFGAKLYSTSKTEYAEGYSAAMSKIVDFITDMEGDQDESRI